VLDSNEGKFEVAIGSNILQKYKKISTFLFFFYL
jgi:hypothetical protein